MNDKVNHRRYEVLEQYRRDYDISLLAFTFNVCEDTIKKIIRDMIRDEWIRRAASIEVEYPVCSHFGCGRTLTPQESLYGNRCQTHSILPKRIDPTLIIKNR